MKQAIANDREFAGIVYELRAITQNLILHAPDSADSTQPHKRPHSPLILVPFGSAL